MTHPTLSQKAEHAQIIKSYFLNIVNSQVALLEKENKFIRLPTEAEAKFISLMLWEVEREYDEADGIVQDLDKLILHLADNMAYTKKHEARMERLNDIKLLQAIKYMFSRIAFYQCSVYDNFE